MFTLHRRCGDDSVRIIVTERSDGDWAPIDGSARDSVTVLRQVHGTRVVEVKRPGEHQGTTADAVWTSAPRATLAVRTADCVPIALYGSDAAGCGVVAAVHAGWRGLLDGIVPAILSELRRRGIRHVRAVVGPHICPLHYEFGTDQLEAAIGALGPSVAARTAWDTPALDLAEAARLVLGDGGAIIDSEIERCTASDTRYYSHRARADRDRTAMLVCLDNDGSGEATG